MPRKPPELVDEQLDDDAPPEPPETLGTHGAELWRTVVGSYELRAADELVVLAQACATLDLVEQLRESIERDGVTVLGAAGQSRVNGALAEVRQQRATLAALLRSLALDLAELDGDDLAAHRDARVLSQRANRARWSGGTR
jgi:hypothetical protein